MKNKLLLLGTLLPGLCVAAESAPNLDPLNIKLQTPQGEPKAVRLVDKQHNVIKGCHRAHIRKHRADRKKHPHQHQSVILDKFVYSDGSTDHILQDFNRVHHGSKLNPSRINTLIYQMESAHQKQNRFTTQLELSEKKGSYAHTTLVLHKKDMLLSEVMLSGHMLPQSKAFIDKQVSHLEKSKRHSRIKSKHFQKSLLLLKQLPGAKVKATLVDTGVSHHSSHGYNNKHHHHLGALKLQITQKRYSGHVAFSNRGDSSAGDAYTQLGLNAFGIMGADSLFVGATQSLPHRRQYKAYEFRHQILTPNGHQLNNSVMFSNTRPKGPAEMLAIKGQGFLWEFDMKSAMVLKQSEQLYVSYGAYINRQSNDVPSNRIFKDKVRALSAKLNYDKTDFLGGISTLQVKGHLGLRLLGATPNKSLTKSRHRGRADFGKVTIDAQRLQPLMRYTSALLSSRFQMSGSKLLSSEQFTLGGADFGRAYNPTTLTGDKGFALSAELRQHFYIHNYGFKRFEPYVYFDYGKVYDLGMLTFKQKNKLASTGLGLRAKIYQLEFNGLWAKPLSNASLVNKYKRDKVFIYAKLNLG